jgi:hypothetical protein
MALSFETLIAWMFDVASTWELSAMGGGADLDAVKPSTNLGALCVTLTC